MYFIIAVHFTSIKERNEKSVCLESQLSTEYMGTAGSSKGTGVLAVPALCMQPSASILPSQHLAFLDSRDRGEAVNSVHCHRAN